MTLAPPFTRGSAPTARAGDLAAWGSPVHAGVRPTGTRTRTAQTGLPRSRGGPPATGEAEAAGAGAPPFTRGSAPALRCSGLRRSGSPVHAGVRPWSGRGCHGGRRLPRSRGGPPSAIRLAELVGMAPPFTRGSALAHRHGHDVGAGSPVHAGVRPGQAGPSRCFSRLPRSRGGPPISSTGAQTLTLAPPFTRGSARPVDLPDRHGSGSPVHAGVRPTASARPTRTTRLPRSRGGPPTGSLARRRASRAPPFTRGSALRQSVSQRCHVGSPVHAGVRLVRRFAVGSGARLPRSRGGPPDRVGVLMYDGEAPPFTRGSARVRRVVLVEERGSPVHAGVRPRSTIAIHCSTGLPRSRGGPPLPADFQGLGSKAPPFTRGSA